MSPHQNLTAIWQSEDTDVVLLLSASPSGPAEQSALNVNRTDLVIQARRRPIIPCWYESLPRGCMRGDSCQFLHRSDTAAPTTDATTRPGLSLQDHLGSADKQADLQRDSSPANDRPLPRRRMGEAVAKITTDPAPTVATKLPDVETAAKTVVEPVRPTPNTSLPRTAPIKTEQGAKASTDHASEVDWTTFDAKLSTLTKPIKSRAAAKSPNPFILIAFPEKFDKQTEAIAAWAAPITRQ
jgi:hypothetical protein